MRFGMTGCLCYVLLGITASAEDEAVGALLKAFQESDRAARSLSERDRLAHYQDWLPRLLAEADKSEGGRAKDFALAECMRLANAIGDFSLSRGLLSRLANSTNATVGDRFMWLTERGEVATLQFRTSKDSGHREDAIASFRKANEIFSSSDESFRRQRSEQFVLNCCWLGEVLDMEPSSVADHEAAADAYKLARDTLTQIGKPTGRLVGLGYDAEYINQREGASAFLSAQIDRSYASFARISEEANSRWPASFYVESAVTKAFPALEPECRAFITGWLERFPEDSRTCVLICDLADSYFVAKEYEKALEIYLQLEVNYSEALIKTDGQFAIEGRGGRLAEVLRNIREIYFVIGRRGEIARVNDKLKKLFPKLGQPQAKSSKSVENVLIAKAAVKNGSLAPISSSPNAWGWVIGVNLAILVVVAVVFVAKKRSAKR